jgi:Na+/H+ antiporter NhaC
MVESRDATAASREMTDRIREIAATGNVRDTVTAIEGLGSELTISAVDAGGSALRPVIGLRDIVGAADSSLALQYGSLAGLFVAILLPLSTRLMSLEQLINGATSGARVVLPAVAILWCASAMSRMTTDTSAAGDATTTPYEFKDQRLYTAAYLTQVLAGGDARDSSMTPIYSVEFLPTIVFVLAAIVAFCTGTSWGTMGILVPMVIPLSHALLTRDGAPMAASDPILLGSIAGVLAGAVFGDHCSPISDTTVLSSQSCGCDHLAHVWTQMPYALAAAGVSIGLGTIPIGFGFPVWLALPLQLVALIGIMFLFGRRVECDA